MSKAQGSLQPLPPYIEGGMLHYSSHPPMLVSRMWNQHSWTMGAKFWWHRNIRRTEKSTSWCSITFHRQNELSLRSIPLWQLSCFHCVYKFVESSQKTPKEMPGRTSCTRNFFESFQQSRDTSECGTCTYLSSKKFTWVRCDNSTAYQGLTDGQSLR